MIDNSDLKDLLTKATNQNTTINRFYVLDKYGYPVETFKGRYIKNFIRYIIHVNFKNTILHYLGGNMIPIEKYKYYDEGFANDAVLLGEDAYNIYEWAFDTHDYEHEKYEEKLEYRDFNNNEQVLDSFNSCNYIVRRKLNL